MSSEALATRRDIRDEPLFKEIEQHFRKAIEPGLGKISGASDAELSPDGARIAFTGSMWETLEGLPATRVCVADVVAGTFETVSSGPNSDRLPRWSPDGSRLAFLSDRVKPGVFQLYILSSGRLGEALRAPDVPGTVEYLQWSPDGSSILLGVAGLGADLAGAAGSGTTTAADDELPAWVPTVEGGAAENDWRFLSVYDVRSGSLTRATREGLNVWEAAWAGNAQVAAIVSESPLEGAWYDAPLALVDVSTGTERILLRSEAQLGLPSASPSGARLAIVEAVCSDRQVVAGDLQLIDAATGNRTGLDTGGVDVSQVLFTREDTVFYCGVRGLASVAGEIDLRTGVRRELWETREAFGLRHPSASPGPGDAFACVLNSYTRYPELTLVRGGTAQTIAAFAHEGAAYVRSIAGRIEEVSWTAPDGLEIEGLLVLPDGPGPHPLILNIHGGPVWSYRDQWQMMFPITPLLASRGFAVLHPNPRGSSGRGQAFARMVFGDMGGADTNDYLSGIDALVQRGIVDPARLGVTGGSYGGYMSAWLVTQTERFAAAVPQAPVTNWLSMQGTCNIPEFNSLFLDGRPYADGGLFRTRSPVSFASRVVTPTFQTTGALDVCTPPTQALEFHRALRSHGVTSALATYPGEGHGVRRFPAVIDQCTRILDWFLRHLPSGSTSSNIVAEGRAVAREAVAAH